MNRRNLLGTIISFFVLSYGNFQEDEDNEEDELGNHITAIVRQDSCIFIYDIDENIEKLYLYNGMKCWVQDVVNSKIEPVSKADIPYYEAFIDGIDAEAVAVTEDGQKEEIPLYIELSD